MEKRLTEIDYIEHKIDYEGWPDALEWLVGEDFGDEELNQLIYDATDHYKILLGFRKEIEAKVDELINKDE